MRTAAARDANEPEIIAALRAEGWVVEQVSSPGFPDLVCAKAGRVVLLEVKMPAGKVTEAQAKVFNRLEAHPAGVVVHVVRTPEEALRAVGAVVESGCRCIEFPGGYCPVHGTPP